MANEENRRTALLAASYVHPGDSSRMVIRTAEIFLKWIEDEE